MAEKYRVPAVMRAFQLLEYLALNGEASFAAIQDDLSLPRSTAFHLLNTFKEAGYADHTRNGMWRLTSKVHELSNVMLSHLDMRTVALPFMRQFSVDTGLGCNLGLIVGDEAIYGAKVASDQHLLSKAWLGKPLSLLGSSLGKILMAWRPEAEVRYLLEKNPLIQKTENTRTDREAYIASLEGIRSEGLAWDREEVTPGVTCFAAPVRNGLGQVLAAVSCSAATPVFEEEKIPWFREKLLQTVAEIEKRLENR